MTNKPGCKTCAHYEYLHEWEIHRCNAQDHLLRDEMIDWEDKCDFYEKYVEESE